MKLRAEYAECNPTKRSKPRSTRQTVFSLANTVVPGYDIEAMN